MKRFIFIVLLGLYSMVVYSQKPCGTVSSPPDPAFESFYQQAIESRTASCNVNYTFPVVVHQLYDELNGTVILLSVAQVEAKIAQINLEYQQAGAPFIFKLAQKDPDGQPTTGVTEHIVEVGLNATFANVRKDKFGNPITWDQTKYLNIYLVIEADGAAAFSQNPSNNINGPSQGVVCSYSVFYDVNGPAQSGVMSHELGHYLNLHHVWGNENVPNWNWCGQGDEVADTPPMEYSNLSTLLKCLPQSYVGCNGQPTNLEHNYMSWAENGCRNFFSEGQKFRMCLAAAYFCDRKPLWQTSNLIATGILPGTTVQVSNIINQSTSWIANTNGLGSTVTVQGNIIVESGATLTIKGITVKFCSDQCNLDLINTRGKLIIKPNAKLILDNAILTNGCDQVWDGVEMWSPVNAPSSITDLPQLFASNSSLIENAIVGIKNYGGPNVNNYAGMINCDETTFKNCHISLDLKGRFNRPSFPLGLFPSAPTFTNCKFNFSNNGNTPNYLNFGFTRIFESHVNLNKLSGNLKFDDCHFTHTLTSSSPDYNAISTTEDLGYGINAASSTFKLNNCSFTGFGYGIHAKKVNNNNSYTCVGTTFKSCAFGIYSAGVPAPYIASNTFAIGDVAKQVSNSTNQIVPGIGIMLDGDATGFKIIDHNDFYKDKNGLLSVTVGLICKNIGGNAGKVKLNSFTGLTHANIANGANGNGTVGLVYECNTFSEITSHNIANLNNGALNATLSAYGLNATAQIAPNQGVITIGGKYAYPGNLYCGQKMSDNFNSSQNLTYYNHKTKPELNIFYSFGTITLKSADEDNPDCVVKKITECPPPCLDTKVLDEAQNEYINIKNGSFIPTWTKYTSRIDASDTDGLISLIRNASSNESNDITEKLMAISPWLSDQVLMTLLDNGKTFGNENILRVLRANPNVISNENLFNYLLNKEDAFTEEQIHELEQSIKESDNERWQLFTEATVYATQMNDLANTVIPHLIHDVDNANGELLQWWLTETGNYALAIDDNLNRQNYNEAKSLLGKIEDVNLQSIKDWQIEGLEREHNSVDLDRFMVASYQTDGNSSILSKNILSEHKMFFEPEYYLPQELARGRSLNSSISKKAPQNNIVLLTPNPNEGLFEVRFKIPNKMLSVNLNIFDAFGKTVQSKSLKGSQGQVSIDLSSQKDGLYFYTVSDKNGTILQSSRFVIAKF